MALVPRLVTAHIVAYIKVAFFYLIFWFCLMFFFGFVTKVSLARLGWVIFFVYESLLFYKAAIKLLSPPNSPLNTDAPTGGAPVS